MKKWHETKFHGLKCKNCGEIFPLPDGLRRVFPQPKAPRTVRCPKCGGTGTYSESDLVETGRLRMSEPESVPDDRVPKRS